VQGDTGQVSFGRGTYASRSAMVGGGALKVAAAEIVARAKPLAAHLMEAAEADVAFEDGRFLIAGTDRSIPLAEVAMAFYRPAGLPKRFGIGLEATGACTTEPASFPNGAHVCELEVDPETGEVAIERYTVVDDLGRIINPLICEGQIQGGIAQGVGQALLENIVHDDSGQLLSGTLAEYCMPRSDDLPAFDISFTEVPCRTNELGVKGSGEAGSVGAAPTVMNALLDALRPLGVAHLDMPATPQRVWQAMARARLERTADPAAAAGNSAVLSVPVSEVAPDRPTQVRVDEHLTLAICEVGGQYYAVSNRCPHQGAPLADGAVEGNLIVCPKHHFKFDLGTGRCVRFRHLRVQTFPVTRENGMLQIQLPPAGPPAVGGPSPAQS
jgi:nitrite reductase/ring-hydroxylating ferredoxin subunit